MDHTFKLPDMTCDSAIHVLDPMRPTRPGFTGTLPLATIADYRFVQSQLGLQRVMISQASAYGFDNSLLLEALDACEGKARGTVVVPADTDMPVLRELHRQGARAIRFMMFGGVLDWSDMSGLAEKAADLGWHFKVQMKSSDMLDYADLLSSLPCRVLMDVYPVTFATDLPSDSVEVSLLADLVSKDNVFVSLSAPNDIAEASKAPHLARRLFEIAPNRCVWSSNWPHLNVHPTPENAHGLRWLNSVVPDPVQRQAVLVDNPQSLFDFA